MLTGNTACAKPAPTFNAGAKQESREQKAAVFMPATEFEEISSRRKGIEALFRRCLTVDEYIESTDDAILRAGLRMSGSTMDVIFDIYDLIEAKDCAIRLKDIFERLRLNNAQKRLIELYSKGHKVEKLANYFKISKSTIHRYISAIANKIIRAEKAFQSYKNRSK